MNKRPPKSSAIRRQEALKAQREAEVISEEIGPQEPSGGPEEGVKPEREYVNPEFPFNNPPPAEELTPRQRMLRNLQLEEEEDSDPRSMGQVGDDGLP